MNGDLRQWVVDTSSLIQIRQSDINRTRQAAVFAKLTALVRARRLIFPPQVREEREWTAADHPEDAALAWVRKVKEDAKRAADDRSDGKGGLQKVSLATAAGLWDLPVTPLAGFVLRFLDST